MPPSNLLAERSTLREREQERHPLVGFVRMLEGDDEVADHHDQRAAEMVEFARGHDLLRIDTNGVLRPRVDPGPAFLRDDTLGTLTIAQALLQTQRQTSGQREHLVGAARGSGDLWRHVPQEFAALLKHVTGFVQHHPVCARRLVNAVAHEVPVPHQRLFVEAVEHVGEHVLFTRQRHRVRDGRQYLLRLGPTHGFHRSERSAAARLERETESPRIATTGADAERSWH
jgi:hypothetical protein